MGYAAAALADPVWDGTIDTRQRVGGVRSTPPSGEALPSPRDRESDHGSAEANDPDRLEDLGDEIATLAAHIHAGTQRFLVLIAQFDRLQGWLPGGHRTCAHWLSFRTGLDLGTAREHVRVARALESLPGTSEKMARGKLSFSQVRALSRVADASNEGDLLELAEGCTTAQLERLVRAWKKGSREDEAEWEQERHRSRCLSVFPDDDGMYVVSGRLDPEVGALLMRSLEAATDALYREEQRRLPMRSSDLEREATRRRADAVGLLAERALAAGFGRGDSTRPDHASACLDASAPPVDAPVSGTRAERYQVVLHVDSATLSERGEPGRSELEDGTRVSAETSRRLSCDVGLVRMKERRDGSSVDVGRRTRTISPALRRALDARDRGCRFPGCGLRFTDAHHIVHWADGGETNLDNTVLLCRYHHRFVHEDGWRIEWSTNGEVAFRDARGTLHVGRLGQAPRRKGGQRTNGSQRPDPSRSDRPRAELEVGNRLGGVEPKAHTAGARWKREADIPDDILFRAMEAVM